MIQNTPLWSTGPKYVSRARATQGDCKTWIVQDMKCFFRGGGGGAACFPLFVCLFAC